MAIPGVQSVHKTMSEDTAAMEAKGFMKRAVKTEIRDYNYSNMEKLRTRNESEECYGLIRSS